MLKSSALFLKNPVFVSPVKAIGRLLTVPAGMAILPVNVGLAFPARPKFASESVPTVIKAESAALRIYSASLLVSANHMNAEVTAGSDAPELLLNSASKLLFRSARTELPEAFCICWSDCAISLVQNRQRSSGP